MDERANTAATKALRHSAPVIARKTRNNSTEVAACSATLVK